MSTLVAIKHTTTYRYDQSVSLSPQLIRLRPAPHCRAEIQDYQLAIEPAAHIIHWQQDPFNNYVARVSFPDKVAELVLQVNIIANIVPINPFGFLIDDNASLWPFDYAESLSLDLQPYLASGRADKDIQNFLQSTPAAGSGSIDYLQQINKKIYETIEYVERLESGVQNCSETLNKLSGSCRDSAWLLVQIYRQLGLAARFVSGYSILLAGESSAENEEVEEDSTDLHAWAEVFIPGAGWIGFDPTSGLLAGEGYIPLCCTRTPASAAALSGTSEPTNTQLFFENTITRLHVG